MFDVIHNYLVIIFSIVNNPYQWHPYIFKIKNNSSKIMTILLSFCGLLPPNLLLKTVSQKTSMSLDLHKCCIIVTETVTCIIASERFTNITLAQKYHNIIAIETQNLHNCNRCWHLHNCYRKCQLHILVLIAAFNPG